MTILGDITYKQFLREFWQKKPLLIRQAFPNFKSLVSKHELLSLSSDDSSQSRIVQYKRKKWILTDGPFDASVFKKLQGAWTLLVQDVNHILPKAHMLLNKFNFIPYARLDDLMISYATPGGGVGPHVDSYDVFLLQGHGKRLWQISNQKDHRLIEDAPLKILKKFTPTDEWIVEPGDMLYLPPNYAHHGVAIDDCMTYSIGFRAPSYQECAIQFFGYLQEHFTLDGFYQDPDLTLSKEPARIPAKMVKHLQEMLQSIRFKNSEIEHFLGMYLTEPKPHVLFTSPKKIMALTHFLNHIKKYGVSLDMKTQMLYIKNKLFINGECYAIKNNLFSNLANNRKLDAIPSIPDKLGQLMYQWYLDGYLILNMARR